MISWSIFCLMACTNPNNSDTAHLIGDVVVATVSMDYSTGVLASADLEDEIIYDEIATISGDPILRNTGDWIWQINRYQYDTLRKYAPSNLHMPIQEISLAPQTGSANPHDIVTCQNQAFVTQYELDELLVLDIDTLAVVDHVSLSEWSDADGIPEASSMVQIDQSIFIALQRLNRSNQFRSEGSIVLQIDCATHEAINVWNIGHNIQLLSWNIENSIIPVLISESDSSNTPDNEDSPSETASGTVYALEETSWQVLWQSDQKITNASIFEKQLLLSHLSEDLSQYQLSCIDLLEQTSQQSTPWVEYLPEIHIQNPQKAWVAAHWGWSDISNAQIGLHQIDLQTCAVDKHLNFALAPVSFAFIE